MPGFFSPNYGQLSGSYVHFLHCLADSWWLGTFLLSLSILRNIDEWYVFSDGKSWTIKDISRFLWSVFKQKDKIFIIF